MATDAGEDDEDVEDQITEKYGIGGINQPIGKQNRHYTYCPLHIAAEKCDIVSIVLLPYIMFVLAPCKCSCSYFFPLSVLLNCFLNIV